MKHEKYLNKSYKKYDYFAYYTKSCHKGKINARLYNMYFL